MRTITWFKVDDGLHGHPKARAAGLTALGLWVVGGSYASDQLTDGHVPTWQIASWAGGKRAAEALVQAGLWLPAPGDGFQFHDWQQCNPTREQEMARRERDRKRQQKWRDQHHRDSDGEDQ